MEADNKVVFFGEPPCQCWEEGKFLSQSEAHHSLFERSDLLSKGIFPVTKLLGCLCPVYFLQQCMDDL